MNDSTINNPIELLFPVLSFIAIFAIGVPNIGLTDTLTVFRWFIILFIFAIATFPLACTIFPKSKSGGFFLSTVLGLLLTSLIVWTLAYIKIPVFSVWGITVVVLSIGAFCYLFKPLRKNLIAKLSEENLMVDIAIEEMLFAIVLVFLCYFKGMYPDINGQEKFMDYGFIMSMLRTSTLPANDMWLSGYSINYYYFGQFLYALLVKFSGISTGASYTISICSAIAIPFVMCYSIGSYLIETAKRFGLRSPAYTTYIGGILTAFASMIFGNSHSFFYDPNGMGNVFLIALRNAGINVGKIDGFFYPDSTRFIGYNPDSANIPGINNGADYTIEEFPFYSYLVGDLHAHVVSTMVVLLIVAVCISLISRICEKPYGEHLIAPELSLRFVYYEVSKYICPEIILCAVLLGIAQMTNYWDFLIYFIFSAMTLLIVMTHESNHFSTMFGFFAFILNIGAILLGYLTLSGSPILHILFQILILVFALVFQALAPCALSRTSCGMSFLFTVAHIIALPFNLNFDMISNKIALCVNHSSLFQLWILWGTHVTICVAFVIFTIIYKNYTYTGGNKHADKIIYTNTTKFHNGIAKFFGERNIVDIFVCGMIVVGILLLIAPEIFYVRDIYTSGYLRSNTMFKFTYAAFIILSIAMSYSISRLFWIISKKGDFSSVTFIVAIAFTISLIIPGHYTFVALKQRCNNNLSKANYKTLDGTNYIYTYASPYTGAYETGNLVDYINAINWFNSEVKGDPVIIEAYGDSYTDYNIVSAYTGLPTVCGWQTHEWLWRYHGVVNKETNLLVSDPNHDVMQLYLTPRHIDISTVYTTDDPNEIQEIINRYNVEYIVIGDLERAKFVVDNTGVITQCGEVAFSSGDLIVVKTTPSGVAS